MEPQITSPSTSHNVDIEAQPQPRTRASSLGTAGSRGSISYNKPLESRKERSPEASVDESGDQDMTGTPRSAPPVDVSPPHDMLPPTDAPMQSEWKPPRADEPLRTKIPESKTTMEDWVKAMEASDDGMCKGWRDQIDNLIIFAGLFSATVTAFTVESYQWLEETPADTLARLQLRDLLKATDDPALDQLAPATFNVSSASVAINTLWFASLTLSLAAVVFGILCRQWLHEYQRYDNFTTEEAFRIHGLRHRGLEAWKVPEIIASLPLLLQMALVLFLVGILVLLWPLQTVVVSIITVIVGLTFLFLGITTALPSIQYIFPYFNTQCAYKSSQSWTFFIISAFWLFDFREFTSWASFDQWEVTYVYNGMGSTLSRVYKLLCKSDDAVLGIYSFLADTSLKPTIRADLALLPDFIAQLDVSQRPDMTNEPIPADLIKFASIHRRHEQLKGCLEYFRNLFHEKLKPRPELGISWLLSTTTPIYHDFEADYDYRSKMQSALSGFIQLNHISHPVLFGRYVDHWAHTIDVKQADGTAKSSSNLCYEDNQYNPDIAMYLVQILRYLMKADRFDDSGSNLLYETYPKLMESYRQREFNPPPVTLLKDIQEWIDRVPKSDLGRQVSYAEAILFRLSSKDVFLRFCEYHTSELEKQYLISFARFFITLYEREDFLAVPAAQDPYWTNRAHEALALLRAYLDQNDNAISGPTESRST